MISDLNVIPLVDASRDLRRLGQAAEKRGLRMLAPPEYTQEHIVFELIHGAGTLGVLTGGPRDWAEATGQYRESTS